jgi:Tfp pilus assembly protein FimT
MKLHTSRMSHRDNSLRFASSGVSTVLFIVVVIILAIIAVAGFTLYIARPAVPTSSSSDQIVTGLAFSHWTAIGDANLTGTMSQYSSSAALWWYVHDSPLNTTSGPYTGSNISATWSKFFNSGPTYWTVYNYSLTFPSSTSAKITADLWYVIGHGNATHTLYLPYELDYSYSGGNWSLTSDWWGLPHAPGVIYNGVVTPSSAISSSSSSTTTSTAPYGY